MKRLGSFVIAVALIAGMVSCGEVAPPTATRYDLTTGVAPGGSGTATDLTNASPYVAGTSVSIKAVAGVGYRFVNWAAPAGTFVNASTAQTTFTMPAQNVTVTANFVRVYVLTMVANPVGQGTATDLTSASPYAEGTSVSIRAVAAAGYHFVNWEASAGTFGNATLAQTTFAMPAQNVTVTASFSIDLYFRGDVCATLHGPASLPLEERNPHACLQIYTNIVIGGVRADLPDGRSITLSAYSDVFTPGVDQRTVFRSLACVPGMPAAGVEYVFTALDMAGEPIPGVSDTDIWRGTEPPDPAANIRAEQTEGGILVSWDESPVIPGSFEPGAKPQLGYYQVEVRTIETSELVYGAIGISASPYRIPEDKAGFVQGRDRGLSLSEMEDGTYRLGVTVHSCTRNNLVVNGECISSDSSQTITFTIQNGKVTIG